VHQNVDRATTADGKNLFRIIWQNSWPVLGAMLLNFIVGYTDVYVAGLLSPDVQAIVGFVSQLYFILIILGNALGVGAVAMVSSAVGQNHWGKVFDFTRQALVMTLLLGILLSGLSFGGADQIIRHLNLPDSIRSMALAYLKIFSLSLLPNYILILMNAVFRAAGKPLIPFQIMGAVTIMNVGANFALVFGWGPLPELGYMGIAWATVLSMLLGMSCVALLLQQPAWRRVWEGPWRPRRDIISNVLRISWPAAILQVAWNAGSLVLFQFLGQLGQQSITAMAAYTNGLRMEAVSYLPAFALNMAAAVLVGQSLGAGSVEQAKRFGWQMARSGALALSILAAILFWLAPQLASILTPDPDVWFETIRYLRINMLSVPFMVFSVVLGGAMQGAGDTKGVMKIIVFAIWIIRIPLAFLLCFPLGLGALGIWLAMLGSMILQSIMITRRFSQGGWHGHK
jgi:putative MATE family efflux protein